MKEITYKHAEGFAAGELKHGPLALVTENTPVFTIVTGDDERARKTIGNVKQVEAWDALVVAITDGQSDVERYADHVLEIPATHPRAAAVLANRKEESVAVYTDGFQAYEPLDEDDAFDHEYAVHGDGKYADGDVQVNTCESQDRASDPGSRPIEASLRTSSRCISERFNFAVVSNENQGEKRSKPSSKLRSNSPTTYAT